MKCKLSTYVVRHYLTTLKYNNISQVCPYKDLGSAKDYIIILLFLMQPSAGDKPDRMQSQEKHNPIYYAQVKTDYESTWQMQLQVPTGAHLIRDSNQARSKQSEDNQLYLDRLNEVLDSLTLTDNKCHFNRVRENEALISSAALSIAYSGVFHSYINALTLFFSIALINPNNIKL